MFNAVQREFNGIQRNSTPFNGGGPTLPIRAHSGAPLQFHGILSSPMDGPPGLGRMRTRANQLGAGGRRKIEM